jgi:DNA-binding MarR family transcriptional regulator
MSADPTQENADPRLRKWQLTMAVDASMRDMRLQLALLDRQVSRLLDMRDVDMDCLYIISRHGPMRATALARTAGLHPATLTGVLDRLEKSGWIVRERDANDRRAVVVRAERERAGQLLDLYRGMNRSMEELLNGYDESQLTVLADFLARAREAGVAATEELAKS